MAKSRAQINNDVRRVLVRHWIDLDRLTIGYHGGAVRVSGELHTLRKETGSTAGISILEILESEIMRIKDVKRIKFDLTNWDRDGAGVWKSRNKRIALGPAARSGATGHMKLVFDKKDPKKKP